jgi:hypothetical protein
MKTKTLLLLCLFLCISMFRLYAQFPVPKNDQGTGAVTADYMFDFWLPAIDGVDDLAGTVTWHVVFFYKDGEMLRLNIQTKDVLVKNPETGEVFKMSESDKEDLVGGVTTWHTNLKGNQGTHYLLAITLDWATGIYTVDKILFPGNKN